MSLARQHHIAVIGAGPSGMRCASRLIEHGCRVSVIEARNRIGGRVAQINWRGRWTDMLNFSGAQFVHGTGYNPVMRIVDKLKTPLHNWSPTSVVFDTSGNRLDDSLAQAALTHFWSVLAEALAYSRKDSQSIDPNTSLYDYFEEACQRDFDQGRIDETLHKLVPLVSKMWGAFVGERVERQSLKYFFLDDCMNEDDAFIASSYRDIMSDIAASPLAKADMQMGSAMRRVESTADGVIVKTANGKQQTYDHVVITCPLGWLKRNPDAISPMPARLAQAINSISYGNLEKVFIEFPRAFWDEGAAEPISFMQWMEAEHATTMTVRSWRMEALSMATVASPFSAPTLLFYTFGECSTHITKMIKGQTESAREEILSDIFEPYYSRLPNFDPTTCKPVSFLASEWSTDEFAGYGSYSNFQIGTTDAAADVECMRHGMPEHHIWFAGEHTSPFDGLGTVNGAYEAGEKVADRIMATKA